MKFGIDCLAVWVTDDKGIGREIGISSVLQLLEIITYIFINDSE
jgi:hypothetical protein